MEEKENTHWRKVMNTKFLNGDEIPLEGFVVKIEKYTEERFYSPKAKKNEDHVMLWFKNIDKPMILTNRKAKQLSRVLRSPFMADWLEKDILLTPISEKHFGEIFKVIHVKTAVVKVKDELTPESQKWEKAKEALLSGVTTIDDIKLHYQISSINQKKLQTNDK
jgi:hypothetical protein|tara:strand:+ start:423 stop:914 length:492 start_codon:yes stop_codon:yes gene_type:complete